MKAIVIDQYGGREQLVERQLESPQPESNQVVLEMKATSINPIDWKVREGYMKEALPLEFPITLGWDAAGVIKEVGLDVKGFKVGDRVFARPATTHKGTYAEEVVVDEHLLAHLPENIPFQDAAAVPLAGLTAWQCLFDFCNMQEGEKVLIHAGSGGVGHYAIQIAKAFGAHVATTASGKNRSWVEELGPDRFIDYKEEDFTEVLEDYDIVLDTLGGDIQSESYRVLKEGGRLVSIAQPPNEEEASKYGVTAGFVFLDPKGEQLAKLADMMVNGQLTSVIGHQFDLTEQGLRDAHEVSESHHAKGKIVINI
ncbi:NADP-dependent oxidoreductase [Halobacillus salinus]|uniref:NADP-dependent oxidoreductase n=1 Tax=Halobacillus salinus TaxID=192814 RepID=UPI0009A61632|nr:NADP-dependent oxidoreductase [Halobacillus salinus]